MNQFNFKLKKWFIGLTTSILTMFIMSVPSFAANDSFAKLDATGNKLLVMGRRIGFWIVLIIATYRVIQCALKGSKKEVGEIIMTYTLIYGALYIIPWILRLVEDIF